MTTTYVGPQTGDKDEVRFLLGDTDTAKAYLTDEEIQWALDKWMPLYGTTAWVAAELADIIAARYASEASISADGVSVSLGPVGDQFRELAAQLRSQHRSLLVGGSPDVGGVSPYEERDPDVKNFVFGIDMHDDLEAGPQDIGDRGTKWYRAEYFPGT